mmetsp:Transcript_6588/g.15113  ORF Transcript_6588/g.15113 Transcript_6588/m.15113 type:complete len:220 (+) Transcript_6588:26-685(+)
MLHLSCRLSRVAQAAGRHPCLPSARYLSGDAPPPDEPPKFTGGYFSNLVADTENKDKSIDYGNDDEPGEDEIIPSDLSSRGSSVNPYAPEELNWVDQGPMNTWKDFRNAEAPDSVCRGKRQRHGFTPTTCELIDLDDLHFTNLRLLEYFLSESGTIKPRKHSGLCAKCQRQVSTTIKQARHMGVIPYIQEFKTVDKTLRLEDLARSGRHDRKLTQDVVK